MTKDTKIKNKRMNRKQLQEFLNQFPKDAIICTDVNNHYSEDGIKYATLVKCINNSNKEEKILFIGNSKHTGNSNLKYNLNNLEIISELSV